MPQNPPPLPDFTRWPSFPFEGDMRVKQLAEPVETEPPRSGEDAADCVACNTPDDAYIWVSERWRVRGMDRPTGLPIVLILECRSHLDIGDLPNLLAAELGVMTVRLERSIRSLDGVARVHVNRWGDGSAHLHMWFLARPYGRLQLRGTFLSLWDDILPVIPEEQWLENLALVAEWLAGFGGRAIAEPAHIQWQSPSTFGSSSPADPNTAPPPHAADSTDSASDRPAPESAPNGANAATRDLSRYAIRNAPAHEINAKETAPDGQDGRSPSPDGHGHVGASAQEGPTPDRPGASSETTQTAEPSPAGDASGTGTAATTANHPVPRDTAPATTAPNHTPVAEERLNTEPEQRPTEAPPSPAQHNPKATEVLN